MKNRYEKMTGEEFKKETNFRIAADIHLFFIKHVEPYIKQWMALLFL